MMNCIDKELCTAFRESLQHVNSLRGAVTCLGNVSNILIALAGVSYFDGNESVKQGLLDFNKDVWEAVNTLFDCSGEQITVMVNQVLKDFYDLCDDLEVFVPQEVL